MTEESGSSTLMTNEQEGHEGGEQHGASADHPARLSMVVSLLCWLHVADISAVSGYLQVHPHLIRDDYERVVGPEERLL